MSAAPPSTELSALEQQLCAELEQRPLASAHLCPSWAPYLRALRAAAARKPGGVEALLAEALALALGPPRTRGHDQRLRAVTREAIERIAGGAFEWARELWHGELGWTAWLGPFLLAHVDPEGRGHAHMQELLGPLTRFLLPARYLDADGALDLLLQRDSPDHLALSTAAPGLRRALTQLLERANAALYGEQAIDASALEWEWVMEFVSYRREPQPAPDRCAVIEVDSGGRRSALHNPTLAGLSSVVYVGPRELLEPPLPLRSRSCWPAPAHDFEARQRELTAAQPGLFAQLERELASRSLAQARSCPSWIVLVDFLLDQGETLLAAWLRAALEDPEREAELGHELTRGVFSSPRKRARYRVHKLWTQRGQQAHWFGPFVLRYFDPMLSAGLGADGLQALLGVHATLLPRARVYTQIERDWIHDALRPREAPLLAPAPCPGSTELLAMLLANESEGSDELDETVRWARPGQTLHPRPNRSIMTNVGPIAADHEATAVLCCETAADLERHAARREHLDCFAHVIVLGLPEVLAAWPYAHSSIREWGQAPASG